MSSACQVKFALSNQNNIVHDVSNYMYFLPGILLPNKRALSFYLKM